MLENTKKKDNLLSKKEALDKYQKLLTILQIKSKMGNLTKVHRIKQLKKRIARLLTKG